MNVLLRDADDKSLRVIDCDEVYIWSEQSVLLFTAHTNSEDKLIPLKKRPDGSLYATTSDGSKETDPNEIIAQLYRDNRIDLSEYDSYYSGDDSYFDLLCGDMSDPTLKSDKSAENS